MQPFRGAFLPLVVLAAAAASSRPALARDLTFEERVRAQEAVERVYYSHQIGATRRFEEAFPRTALERKIRTVLAKSAALETFWNTPITGVMLRDETLRIARQTRLPERLQEIYDALGGDPLLFQETVARATLVDRLLRGFYAGDPALHAAARAEAEALRARLLAGTLNPGDPDVRRTVVTIVRSGDDEDADQAPALAPSSAESGAGVARPDGATLRLGPDRFRRMREALPARAGEPGPVADEPGSVSFQVLLVEDSAGARVATYSVAKRSFDDWWAGVEPSLRGGRVAAVETAGALPPPGRSDLGEWNPDSALAAARVAPASLTPSCTADTWDTSALGALPDARMYATAVWTGSLMIVWGGSDHIGTPFNTGGRYDPLTDNWSAMSMRNVPDARYWHTAVWTGSLMIVWGGTAGGPPLGSGSRYDPATDSWSATSPTNAPASRELHAAIWTGTRMVIWGGFRVTGLDGGFDSTGGRYDPVSDTWVPTSLAGAPVGRYRLTAVWNGHQMMVWGGQSYVNISGGPVYTYYNSGGLYDPTADAWTPISTTNAPAPRYLHTAVWTGTVMVVWGGANQATYLSDGGRYDPTTGLWSAIASSGAPSARTDHTAVWTGTSMIVWGGTSSAVPYMGDGGIYHPSTNTWSPMTASGAPVGRQDHVAVWTGSRMIVWSGFAYSLAANAKVANTGGRYDPVADLWTPTSMSTIPEARSLHSAVWTGNVLIIWGGAVSLPNGFPSMTGSGARYDPTLDAWTATSLAGAPDPRQAHTAVWTGRWMIVWGGFGVSGRVDTGGRYDPAADAWSPTSTADPPDASAYHTAVWTGRLMLIWGGYSVADSTTHFGRRYDPVADVWSRTSLVNVPMGRNKFASVWTGRELIVWGGAGPANIPFPNTGGRYDPAADTWQAISVTNAPAGREAPGAVWTGGEMIVWGGDTGPGNTVKTGGRYDPVTDSWISTATAGAPSGRSRHSVVWSGDRMVVWGGSVSVSPDKTGGIYDPATDAWSATSYPGAPLGRWDHTGTWTPFQMLVWGGSTYEGDYLGTGERYCVCTGSTTTYFQDLDGDGHGDASVPVIACSQPPGSAVAGDDCDDGTAAVWGTPGEVPELDFLGQTTLGWTALGVPGGTNDAYDLLRSSAANDFVTNAACIPTDASTRSAVDEETPPVGGFFFYLIRASDACPAGLGSLGSASDGTPRAGRTCP